MEHPASSATAEQAIILLLGATGSGKSTLGNFLTNPATIMDASKCAFERGNTERPQTEVCSVAAIDPAQEREVAKRRKYLIVDTPGLAEPEPDKDLRHMIDIFKALASHGCGIAAVLLCMRWDQRVDHQLETLLRYYAAMLGDIMLTNFLVVMTHYCESDEQIAARASAGRDIYQLQSGIKGALQQIFGEALPPCCVPIDSFPVYTSKLAITAAAERRQILIGLIDNMPCFPCSELRLVKPHYWQVEDKVEIGKVKERINGWVDEFKGREERAFLQARGIADAENLKAGKRSEFNRQERQLQKYDSDAPYRLDFISISKPWLDGVALALVFSYHVEEVERQYSYPITQYEVQTTGQVTVDHSWRAGDNSFKAKCVGGFFRGLMVELVLYTTNRHRYAKEVKDLRPKVDVLAREVRELEDKIRGLVEEQQANERQMKDLQAKIDAELKQIALLAGTVVSIEEAEKRLRKDN